MSTMEFPPVLNSAGEQTEKKASITEHNYRAKLKRMAQAATLALFIGLGLGAKEGKAAQAVVPLPEKPKIEYFKRWDLLESYIRKIYLDLAARPADFEGQADYNISNASAQDQAIVSYQQRVWETSIGIMTMAYPSAENQKNLPANKKNQPVFVMLTNSGLMEDSKTHEKVPVTSTYFDWQADGEIDGAIFDCSPAEAAWRKKNKFKQKEIDGQMMAVLLAQLEQSSDDPSGYPAGLFAQLFKQFEGQNIIIYLTDRQTGKNPKIIKLNLRNEQDNKTGANLSADESITSYDVLARTYYELLKGVQVAQFYRQNPRQPSKLEKFFQEHLQ